jgi:uncharacterized protein
MPMNVKTKTTAWYREPWPWILMAGPLIVIVAGAITSWLAFTTADGLVEDDYYKQGLAVNQRMHRDVAAAAGALSADLMLGTDSRSIRLLFVTSKVTGAAPARLNLSFAHPTRSGLDQKVVLQKQPEGFYVGRISTPLHGRWHVTLDDASGEWRLLADWDMDHNSLLKMMPMENVGHSKQGT